MHIHQMSVSYVPEQDRVLMRVNTREGEEMRVWLTRRLMAGLWPLLTRLLTDHLLKLEDAGTSLTSADDSLKKMLADFRKEEFLRKADFDTPFQPAEPAQLPLGEDPLLITDVDATPMAGGPLRLTFNERLPTGEKPRSFNLEMKPKLMQGLMHLLDTALQQSRWRESFVSDAPVEEPSVDEDPAGRKPRYLN
ncbi:hypothetical protein [Ramlibacter sp.]|uniref:hypothetical protein n=1 Tax=Ramlibacter sp. TaxID=1917967 RepID=UPI0017C977BA|nr:hypothetical protein [Ramlibacter sp.]MBA2672120.1 hypothetical protein [Ramlibacter sp.]